MVSKIFLNKIDAAPLNNLDSSLALRRFASSTKKNSDRIIKVDGNNHVAMPALAIGVREDIKPIPTTAIAKWTNTGNTDFIR